MARLQVFKPLGDAERTSIFFDALYDDVQTPPEVAVVLALDDFRLTEEKFFPSVSEVMREVSVYRDLIYELLDFL